MQFRILKVNTSPVRQVYKHKIQVKRDRKWIDYRVHGAVKLFDHAIHAENYLNLMNKS